MVTLFHSCLLPVSDTSYRFIRLEGFSFPTKYFVDSQNRFFPSDSNRPSPRPNFGR